MRYLKTSCLEFIFCIGFNLTIVKKVKYIIPVSCVGEISEDDCVGEISEDDD